MTEAPRYINLKFSLNCKLASWVKQLINCNKFFIKNYGWPFEESDIERFVQKIIKDGLSYTGTFLPPYDKCFGEVDIGGF